MADAGIPEREPAASQDTTHEHQPGADVFDPAQDSSTHDSSAQDSSAQDSVIADVESDVDTDVAAMDDETAEPIGAEGVLAAVTAERDEYLDALQRLKAEFDNHRRRTTEQASQLRQQAAANLVEKLLPVLDSCDAALAHDAEAVRPVLDALTEVLSRDGLEVLQPLDAPFDPEYHEAVMHEEGEGNEDVPTVSAVLRAGYVWHGRVLRPAMVKVRG